MGIKNRFIAILSALALCISVCTFTVAAIDADGDGYDDETGELIDVVSTDAPATGYETEPVNTEPYTETPATTAPLQTEPETEYVPETEPETEWEPETEPITEEPSYGDGGSDLYYSENSDYYIGGGQSWYTVPQETAPSASLYESNRKIDDKELSDSDWKDIAANLKNASLSGSGGDDFDFIKKNSSTSDNGEWMLIVGIVCLLLAAAGIAYTVVSVVAGKKKLGRAYAGNSAGSPRSSRRASDDYGDGYRQTRGKSSKNRSSKFDTADVYVKKPSDGKRYNNNSKGSRYK